MGDKGKFKSNFGFLMATIGSAVGLGNIWGFPFKMGKNGGFAFLIIYIVLAVIIGYCIMLGEIAFGRKQERAAIEAYRKLDSKFVFNGWINTLTPLFLICFYCTLGGYCLKYTVANFGNIFNANWGTVGVDSGDFFGGFISDTVPAIIYGLIFLVITVVVVLGGVAGGIEKFSVIAMPALFVMLLIVIVRSVTLPGAMDGIAFMFKPDWSVFHGSGWITVLAAAGGQMFFSLSISSGCIIAYGSYLGKSENLEKNSALIITADTVVAILAGIAVMPAVFAFGLEPDAGPSLLFVTLQTVFNSMGGFGALFGFIFYFLVLIAALTSSVGMLEGAVSSFMDEQERKGKTSSRTFVTIAIGIWATLGSTLVSADALGGGGLPHIFGFDTWIDTFDLIAEGFLMPLGGLFMVIIMGWLRPGYLDDEVRLGSSFGSKNFFYFCMKFLSPIFLVFILIGQLNGFFKWGLF